MEKPYVDIKELLENCTSPFNSLNNSGISMGKKMGAIYESHGDVIILVGTYKGLYPAKTYAPGEHPDEILSEGTTLGFLEATVLNKSTHKTEKKESFITLNPDETTNLHIYVDAEEFKKRIKAEGLHDADDRQWSLETLNGFLDKVTADRACWR